MPKVTIYSRPQCCLCDDVKQQLEKLRRGASFELEQVNIDEHEELKALYGDEVPVVMIDGRKAFKNRLDPEEFLKKLAAASNSSSEPRS
jgi:glutaredoxin